MLDLNNMISWTPLTQRNKLDILVIWKMMYNILRVYLIPSTKFIVLWQRMNKIRKSNIRPSYTKSTSAH